MQVTEVQNTRAIQFTSESSVQSLALIVNKFHVVFQEDRSGYTLVW